MYVSGMLERKALVFVGTMGLFWYFQNGRLFFTRLDLESVHIVYVLLSLTTNKYVNEMS